MLYHYGNVNLKIGLFAHIYLFDVNVIYWYLAGNNSVVSNNMYYDIEIILLHWHVTSLKVINRQQL